MSKSVGIAILLLVSLLIGGSVYAFLQTHERKDKVIHTGLLGEARNNPLYASRLFLKRMGIPTKTQNSIQGLVGFPDIDTVIIIDSKRSSLSPRRTRELIEWVKSGGHVIALATHNWSYRHTNPEENLEQDEYDQEHNSATSPDPLQSFLGVRTGSKITYNDLAMSEQLLVDKIEEQGDDYKIETLFNIRLKGVDKNLAIANIWYNPILIDESNPDSKQIEIIKLRSSNFMIRHKVGEGMVTLVSSLNFIDNRQIEKANHAEILWYLIHGLHTPLNQPAAVWLIHNDKMPSLWDMLWRNAWMLILSLLFLLIAWLLTSTRRFGPLIYKEEEDRRSLNEHISSSGNFYWNSKNKKKLLDSSRIALNQKLSKTHPGWNHLSKEQKVTLINQKSKLSPEVIHRILFAPAVDQADEFTQLIRQIENIRHSI